MKILHVSLLISLLEIFLLSSGSKVSATEPPYPFPAKGVDWDWRLLEPHHYEVVAGKHYDVFFWCMWDNRTRTTEYPWTIEARFSTGSYDPLIHDDPGATTNWMETSRWDEDHSTWYPQSYTMRLAYFHIKKNVEPTPNPWSSKIWLRYWYRGFGQVWGPFSAPDIDVSVHMTEDPDFSISASPNSLTIPQDDSGISAITVTSENDFSDTVSFTVSGAPSGVSASLSPTSVTLPSGASAASALTVSVGSSAALGTYTLTVEGTNGTLTHTVDVMLNVVRGVPEFPFGGALEMAVMLVIVFVWLKKRRKALQLPVPY